MKTRGFTVLEVAIAATLMAMLLGTVAVSIHGDVRTHRVLVAPVSPLLRGQKVVERMGAELRMASEWGEDRDHDGTLDTGEDTNGNGVLDADWNLADGVVDQKTLAFNRRIDLRDSSGAVISTGLHSRRVTYRLVGDRIVREWQVTVGYKVVTRTAIMAYKVSDLSFSRQGSLVAITVDMALPDDVKENGVVTIATRIRLRN